MGTQTIFEVPPQTTFDMGEPRQDGLQFPQTLTEKYQPATVEGLIGLDHPKRLLAGLAAGPKACAMLFVGPPGSGKTVAGMAFAAQLPGTLMHIGAQKCDVAALDDLADKFAYYPPRGNWWVCLVDEADQMTEKAQLQLLSRLDGTAALKPKFGGGFERGTPPPVIWIFTANGTGEQQTEPPYALLPRFRSRCMTVPFLAPGREDLADFLEQVWTAEGGAPQPREYFMHMADGVGVRDALTRLDVDLLAWPRPVPAERIMCSICGREPAIVGVGKYGQCVNCCGKVEEVMKRVFPPLQTAGHSDSAEMRSLAARKAWETRRARRRGR